VSLITVGLGLVQRIITRGLGALGVPFGETGCLIYKNINVESEFSKSLFLVTDINKSLAIVTDKDKNLK